MTKFNKPSRSRRWHPRDATANAHVRATRLRSLGHCVSALPRPAPPRLGRPVRVLRAAGMLNCRAMMAEGEQRWVPSRLCSAAVEAPTTHVPLRPHLTPPPWATRPAWRARGSPAPPCPPRELRLPFQHQRTADSSSSPAMERLPEGVELFRGRGLTGSRGS